jgi:hypothetical protein
VLEGEVAKVRKEPVDSEGVYSVFLPPDLVVPLVLTMNCNQLRICQALDIAARTT